MAGHNKWSKIKRDKGANDAKRGAVFTRIGNQIAIAARNGADPSMNPALQMAIEKARAANMPKDNIQRSIDRVSGKNAALLEEVTYEGFGPGGIGIIIETATDNRNRTLPEVKTALVKNGGRIADAGSVAFMFERKGVIRVSEEGEELLLAALEAGGEDVQEDEGGATIITDQKDLARVREGITAAGYTVEEAELCYVPQNYVQIDDEEVRQKIEKVLDVLEDLDDVVNVHTNVQFS